jgi:hypothetical protein
METITVEDQIDSLLNRIKYGDCVLFLGPEVLVNTKGAALSYVYSNLICSKMVAEGIEYDDSRRDDIYYTVNRYIKGRNQIEKGLIKTTELTLKRDYGNFLKANMKASETLEKLAKLPFYLTINTNPDDLINGLIQANIENRSCRFWYYDVNRNDNELQAENKLPGEINAENYVVFNAYGHSADDHLQSIIIREAEFLEFSKKINNINNGIPAVLKNFIKNNKICLFIGFQYESWPLKVLLHALGFSKEIPDQNISFNYRGLLKYQSDFFKDELKFMFIDSDPEGFIHSLYHRYLDLNIPNQIITHVPKQKVKIVFISDLSNSVDAKKDNAIRNKISGQLKPLEMKGQITMWAEDYLPSGTNIENVRRQCYSDADIFVLIAGASILGSEEYYSRIGEVLTLLEQNPRKKFIPVYASYFMYNAFDAISTNNWIPTDDAKPVPILDGTDSDIDRKVLCVCEKIKNQIFDILQDAN